MKGYLKQMKSKTIILIITICVLLPGCTVGQSEYSVPLSSGKTDNNISATNTNSNKKTHTEMLSVTPETQSLQPWSIRMGNSYNDFCNSIAFDGSIFACGVKTERSSYKYDPYAESAWAAMISSQGQTIWEKAYGGYYSDVIYDFIETSDNNKLLYGHTSSNDGDCTSWHEGYDGDNIKSDGWLLKINSKGEVIWSKCFGGSGEERIYKAAETIEGNIVFISRTTSPDGQVSGYHSFDADYSNEEKWDVWICCVSSEGEILWEKAYGGGRKDDAIDMIIIDDRIYILANTRSFDGDLAGITNNSEKNSTGDAWLICLTMNGETVFQKCLGNSYGETGSIISFYKDSIYIVGLGSSSDKDSRWHEAYDSWGNPIPDVWLSKISLDGNLVWGEYFGGTDTEQIFDIAFDEDNIVLLGDTVSSDGDAVGSQGKKDIFLINCDINGKIEYIRTIGGEKNETGTQLIVNDNLYMVIGMSNSKDFLGAENKGRYDVCLTRIDKSGNVLSNEYFGGSSDDGVNDAYIVDEKIIIAGYTDSYDGDIGDYKSALGDGHDTWIACFEIAQK